MCDVFIPTLRGRGRGQGTRDGTKILMSPDIDTDDTACIDMEKRVVKSNATPIEMMYIVMSVVM